MSLLAAFMVPHPPLIIPEIGRGDEKTIEKTVDSYERVAKEIAGLHPDTIIICSPHKESYADYFLVSTGELSGTFADFGAPQVNFQGVSDDEFVAALEKKCQQENISAGSLNRMMNHPMDHGTMIPLWFINKYLTDYRIVNVGISGFSLLEHYHLGMIMAETAEKLNRRTVFVASGDLSHKLKDDGPYGFADEGPEYDMKLMDVCARGALGELLDFSDVLCRKAAECGHRPFTMMAGALDGKRIRSTVYSHEDVTGVGYGVCSFYPDADDMERKFFAEKISREKDMIKTLPLSPDPYVRLAQNALYSYVISGRQIRVPDDLPEDMLNNRAGVFVSIHQMEHLRGCIGTIGPTQDSIAGEIIRNAILAATEDPRFLPIREYELDELEVNVDVLGEIEDISSPRQLNVKRYGVIVRKGDREGLLLPNLDGVTSVKQQISIAKQKAGIGEYEEVSLQRFEVVRHI